MILSLDADFLYAGFPGFTRYVRDFAKRRNPDAGEMSRLYVVESTPTSTGAKADHRLPVRAAETSSNLQSSAAIAALPDRRAIASGRHRSSRNFIAALVKRPDKLIAVPASSSPATINHLRFTRLRTP